MYLKAFSKQISQRNKELLTSSLVSAQFSVVTSSTALQVKEARLRGVGMKFRVNLGNRLLTFTTTLPILFY